MSKRTCAVFSDFAVGDTPAVFSVFISEKNVFELLKGSKMTCAVFSDFVPSCKTSVKIVILNPVSSPSIIGAAASGRRTYKGGRRASRAAPPL